METLRMGKVTVPVRVENLSDSLLAQAGSISPDQVRSAQIDDAIVDTGAKLLALPKRLIEQLGLECFESRKATTSVGVFDTNIYRAVWLTIDGRRCTVDVAEVPDVCPALIGYVPLELLDMVVDPVRGELIPNPKDGGQRLLDLF